MKIEVADNRSSSYFQADWAEIVNRYRDLVEGNAIPTERRMTEFIQDWKEGDSFYSNSSEEVLDFLVNGYEFESEVEADVLPVVTSYKKRQRYSDDPEGEYSHDLYLMGETDHFLTIPKRESLIGIRMSIMYDFLARVPTDVIKEYAQWIGSAIDALQKKGYDLEIMLTSYGINSYTNVNKSQFDIRLSKFGERVMPYDWSACFSPGGFRHFFFVAIVNGAELDEGLKVTYGLGSSPRVDWDIGWEPKAREITITCDPGAMYFPAEEMTDKFGSWTE